MSQGTNANNFYNYGDTPTHRLIAPAAQPKERPFTVALLRFTAKAAAVIVTLAAVAIALAALNSLT